MCFGLVYGYICICVRNAHGTYGTFICVNDMYMGHVVRCIHICVFEMYTGTFICVLVMHVGHMVHSYVYRTCIWDVCYDASTHVFWTRIWVHSYMCQTCYWDIWYIHMCIGHVYGTCSMLHPHNCIRHVYGYIYMCIGHVYGTYGTFIFM